MKLLSIITCDNQYHQSTIDTGIIPRLVQLLSINDNINLKQAVLEVMNNIAENGSNEQKLQILECQVLSQFHLLLSHCDEDLRLEARAFVSLITEGTSAQMKAVIDASLVPLIIEKLMKGDADERNWAKKEIKKMIHGADADRIGQLIQCGIVLLFSEVLADGTQMVNVSSFNIHCYKI